MYNDAPGSFPKVEILVPATCPSCFLSSLVPRSFARGVDVERNIYISHAGRHARASAAAAAAAEVSELEGI